MQYPIVREYKPDVTMSLKENEIEGELKKIPKRDFIYAIVPKYAPFFLESLVITLPNGEELLRDVHYQIPGVMGNLTRLCGRSVCAIIEIIDENIEEVLISYHTMGHFNVLDESMYALMESAINDSRPIEWDNVTDKPIVFPPEMHHHSLIYDFHSYRGLMDMIENIMRLVDAVRVDPVVIRARQFFATMNKYIDIYDRQIRESLARHIGAHDSHGITKEQVGLGHLDNIATATDAEVSALKDNLRMTTKQLGLIIKDFVYKNEEFLPPNLIPFSQYSGDDFIPKYTLGNYANLEFDWKHGVIIKEEDGTFSGLMGGLSDDLVTDQVVILKGDKDINSIKNTGHSYTHPYFEERNLRPYEVVQLDSDFIIIVAEDLTSAFFEERYFISRSNGTVNPAKHFYSEIKQEYRLGYVNISATIVGEDVLVLIGSNYVRVISSFKLKDLGKSVVNLSDYPITYPSLPSNNLMTDRVFIPVEGKTYGSGILENHGFNFAEETGVDSNISAKVFCFRAIGEIENGKIDIFYSNLFSFSKSNNPNTQYPKLYYVLYELDVDSKVLTIKRKPTEFYFDNNNFTNNFITRYTAHGGYLDKTHDGKYFLKGGVDFFSTTNNNIVINGPSTTGNNSYYNTLDALLDSLSVSYPPSALSSIVNPYAPLTTRNALQPPKIDTSGFKVVFNTPEKVVFGGNTYNLPAQTLLLSDYASPPTNRKFYLYVRLVNGSASYTINTSIVNETATNLFVGTITTNSNIVTEIKLNNVTLINDHRLSIIKMGNTIPVTLGSIREEGLIPIIKKPTDLV